MIKIADNLNLPNEAVTQTFAQIGRKGAGKTYLASMIAEQMLDVQAQVIVIDPIGNWWGLRVNADGKSKGKDVYVMGGAHGDVPLSSEAGKEIAKILSEKHLSVVLDISEFRKNERKRFVTDFAEEFYHLKKTRPSAVHIFLEESQKFVPQRVQKDEARMLGAWEDIVRLGRNYGIGCSLISQRPQSVNKEVLSQVECLCVLQLTGLHERKALEEWVQEAGEDRKIVGELPSFKTGEGYVWSPSWLRIFKKVKFNKKTTMDTSATPELGKATKVAKLSKIDIKKLQKFMADVIDKSQKDLKDIKDHKKEIMRLKAEVTSMRKSSLHPKEVVDTHAIERARQQGTKEGFKEAERIYARQVIKIKEDVKQLQKVQNNFKMGVEHMVTYCNKLLQTEIPKLNLELIKSQPQIKPVPQIKKVANPSPIRHQSVTEPLPSSDELVLGKCARGVYSFLYNNAERSFSKIQIAVMTEYSVKSSGFLNAISQLNASGLIRKDDGLLAIGESDPSLVEKEEQVSFSKEMILRKIGKCPREIMGFLLDNPHDSFTKEDIAENTPYSVSSSGFLNAISKLNTMQLIKKEGANISINPEILEL